MSGRSQNLEHARLMGGQNKAQKMEIRMEIAAEKLLAGPLRRRRWLAADRDKIAAFLQALVMDEINKVKNGEQ